MNIWIWLQFVLIVFVYLLLVYLCCYTYFFCSLVFVVYLISLLTNIYRQQVNWKVKKYRYLKKNTYLKDFIALQGHFQTNINICRQLPFSFTFFFKKTFCPKKWELPAIFADSSHFHYFFLQKIFLPRKNRSCLQYLQIAPMLSPCIVIPNGKVGRWQTRVIPI